MNITKTKKLLVVLVIITFTLTLSACDSNGIEDELSNGNDEEDDLIRETINDVDGLVSILEQLEAEDEVLIEFEDGVYEKNIAIYDNYEFAELTLIAENKHEAILKQQPNESGIEIMDSSNITISGFKIVGDNENLDEKVGIGVWRSENITINDSHIMDFPFQGIYVDDSKVNIENNIIENNDHGGIEIVDSGEKSTIINNNIENNNYSGIIIDFSEAYIYDNYISKNESSAILINDSIADIIDNNILDSIEGIYISDSEGDIKSEDITITGNYFDLKEWPAPNIKYYYIGFDLNYEGDLETIKNANEYEQNIGDVKTYNPSENPDLIGVP